MKKTLSLAAAAGFVALASIATTAVAQPTAQSTAQLPAQSSEPIPRKLIFGNPSRLLP